LSADIRFGPDDPLNEFDQLTTEANGHGREVQRLVQLLTAEQLGWRPREKQWSVGEHIDHLSRTTRRYARAIRVALHNARKHGLTGGGPFRRSLFGTWFVHSLEPPVRIRVKTLPMLNPDRGLPAAQLLAEFTLAQEIFNAAVREAEGVDIGRATMRSPFVSILKLTIGEALEAVLAHNRRHLWHINRILNDPRFKNLTVIPATAELTRDD